VRSFQEWPEKACAYLWTEPFSADSPASFLGYRNNFQNAAAAEKFELRASASFGSNAGFLGCLARGRRGRDPLVSPTLGIQPAFGDDLVPPTSIFTMISALIPMNRNSESIALKRTSHCSAK
jgi:hypothetical protein